MDFLLQLEQSGFSTWVREGGTIWSYPFILFMHTLGLATLAGVNGGIDLRILGFAQQLPLAPLKRFFPLLWVAFAVTAASGTALLIADATTKLASPVFYVKMVFVALALANLQLLKTHVFGSPEVDTRPLPHECQAPGGHVAVLLDCGHHGRPSDGLSRSGQRPRLAVLTAQKVVIMSQVFPVKTARPRPRPCSDALSSPMGEAGQRDAVSTRGGARSSMLAGLRAQPR